ncbi:MAG: 5-oxoprolinase subunit PxpB [Pedobacter sp.]|jgi:inhibitor of KinA|uniref:5-oxoprolinase subunit PxpB n=1 Tax=Pedobacter sp. TaxID=1411316 RepID=UPI00339304A0
MNELQIRDVRFYPLGDTAIVARFAEEISNATHDLIQSVCNYLEEYSFDGFTEYVPAFTTVTIFYEPMTLSYQSVQAHLEEMLAEVMARPEKPVSRFVEIPVVYGGIWGPDLDIVASHANLDTAEVIRLHTEAEYLVHMIGFAPGFPYLGGLNEKIAAPRKEIPRAKILAGSVGIAGKQTGIYPIATPGGWQIIGRTAVRLFDVKRQEPSLLRAGDRIRFVPVTQAEFDVNEKTGYGN